MATLQAKKQSQPVKHLPVKAIADAFKAWQAKKAEADMMYSMLKERIFDEIGMDNGRFDFGEDAIFDVVDETTTLKCHTDKLRMAYPEIWNQFAYETTQARYLRPVPKRKKAE